MIIDTDRLISQTAYAEMKGLTTPAITRQINEDRVDFLSIKGGLRVIILPEE